MAYAQLCTPWLSDTMALALAAMCPPLTTTEVSWAAVKLDAHMPPAHVIDEFLQLGADLMNGRQVVEALGALRDMSTAEFELVSTLSSRADVEADTQGEFAAAERILQEIARVLARLVSPLGAQSIVLRAIRLAEVDFPFLEPLRAAIARDVGFASFGGPMNDIDPTEACKGMLTVSNNALRIVSGFIGEDLTSRLVRAA